MRSDGSWGYNLNYVSDSDSTAHAILFLRYYGLALPDKCYMKLLSFQQKDGGFATFAHCDPSDSWGKSHPDVTPVVPQALLTRFQLSNVNVQQGIGFVLSREEPECLWPSFWWTTALYSTLANVRLLEQIQIPYQRECVLETVLKHKISEDNPFQLALLGEILSFLRPENPVTLSIGHILTKSQLPDGSWLAPPILRITNHQVS